MLKVLDLFSGVGGFSLGLERTGGFKTVAFCEIEPYCRSVLAKHWPGIPCYGDIRTLTANQLRSDGIAVDVICGGFPCQDISSAGKRAGINGSRSQLWSEFARLIGELRPSFVIVENVAALLRRGMDRVLADLAHLGYDAEWECLQASDFGAPHRRKRIIIVAYPQRDQKSWAEPRHWPFRRMGGFIQSIPWDSDWQSALTFFRGMDDGIPHIVDRTDAMRNSIIPQIPELIGHAILNARKPSQETI